MNWLWTWGGKCFGYRQNDNLFTADGENVGYFENDEVYACTDGRYLGELKNERLITNQSKKSHHRSSRVQTVGGSFAGFADYVGYAMYAGYEDFMENEK